MCSSKEELIQPFFVLRGNTGILLVHGFTACPIDMRPLGEKFVEFGYTVYAPLLPGHGTTPEDMKSTSWEDWLNTAQKGIVQLAQNCSKVIAVGHSMGGLIALALAAQGKLSSVVSINAPIIYQEKELHFVDRLLGKQDYIYKSQKDNEMTINREGLPHFSYTKVPVECFVSLNQAVTLVQHQLKEIECPVLVIQSLKDKTVHPRSGRMIEKNIKHNQKDIMYWANEDHYIVLSAARNKLGQKINDFIQKFNIN